MKAGDRVHDWELLSEAFRRKGMRYWRCRCLLCGSEHDVSQGNLRTGQSKSCRSCGMERGRKSRERFNRKGG